MHTRTGLRIRADKIDPKLAQEYKDFAVWLRRNCNFPTRVPVYLSPKKYVIDCKGERCDSIFFAPFDNKVEPYIRIATGDYDELIRQEGEKNAVVELLFSLALNIHKYLKWVESNSQLESYDAKNDATILLKKYLVSVDMA